jgi:hypothetical protein
MTVQTARDACRLYLDNCAFPARRCSSEFLWFNPVRAHKLKAPEPQPPFLTMAKIALRLNTQKISEKITLALRVHDMMSADAGLFTAPVPTLAAFRTQITDLQDSQQRSIKGSVADTIDRDQKLAIVEASMKNLALYAQSVSNGDPAVLVSAGFDLAKPGVKYTSTETPLMLAAANTPLSGEVKLRWSRIVNARLYEVQSSNEPASEDAWEHYSYASGGRLTVVNQPSGGIKWYRVRALSAAGASDWSSPISKRVS